MKALTIEGLETEFILLVFILLLLGFTRQAEFERLNLFIRSFTNPMLADQQIRQERSFTRFAALIFFVTLASLSVFCALCIEYFQLFQDVPFLALASLIFVGFILLTTARTMVYSFTSWLFSIASLQQVHTFHWLLTNFILSLFLLPLSALYFFGPMGLKTVWVYTGITSLILFFSVRVFRLFYISASSYRVPLMYNFLYLCALEILPLLLVIAVILRQFAG